MNQTKIELLAPAGDFACFQAAMNAGADAVYAAGARFGARAYANNFTQDELIEAIERAQMQYIWVEINLEQEPMHIISRKKKL